MSIICLMVINKYQDGGGGGGVTNEYQDWGLLLSIRIISL